MGLASSQLRLIFLTLYQSDLEFKISTVTSTKMQIANSVNELFNVGSDLDPDSPEMQVLNQRRQKLELVEKQLDAALLRYQTQLKAVDTEVESIKQIIDKNVKSGFSYGSR